MYGRYSPKELTTEVYTLLSFFGELAETHKHPLALAMHDRDKLPYCAGGLWQKGKYLGTNTSVVMGITENITYEMRHMIACCDVKHSVFFAHVFCSW